jgi:hypothetical protein
MRISRLLAVSATAVSRTLPVTFLMGYATQPIYAHEIGHTFGLCSGECGGTHSALQST